jgi:hypothetical protein
MTNYIGLDVSQKMTAICIVDNAGRRLWRGQCPSVPERGSDWPEERPRLPMGQEGIASRSTWMTPRLI